MKITKTISGLILFTLFLSKASGQEITVFPGFWSSEYYQDDEKIDKEELKALLKKNDEVNAYWKKAQGQEIVAGVATAAEVGLLIWTYSELLDDNRTRSENAKKALGPLIGSLGALVIGTVYLNASNKSKKKAILTYNKQFDNKTTFRLIPMGNQNGIGLALKF